MKEEFYRLFTDDPVNWVKWAAVFAVLILGYVAAVPLYKKVSYRLSWERKRDIARSKRHMLEAKLVKKHPSGEPSAYDWRAVYRYSLEGKEKQYRAYFKHPSTPPLTLYLYYIENPKKVFCYEEYHWENHKAVILFPLMFLPWILAMLAIVFLGIPLPVNGI